MPARAISAATISFGLVSIPVKKYSAAEPKSALSFNQINRKDGARQTAADFLAHGRSRVA
jgi:DNA end-binding protein Ku